ncbi:MAG: ComEA family DNA-binding protein [Gammaproteobacteria bacterium]|nr:ComEA family DNA-binding protein [Gammaproteobacteria bacterium]
MEIFKKILLALCLLIPTLLFAETININTADKESLMSAIKGVGEKRAEAIIAYREEHGSFKSLEELADVKGVGPSIVEANMENISVEDE